MAERPVICEEFPIETPLLPAQDNQQPSEVPDQYDGDFFDTSQERYYEDYRANRPGALPPREYWLIDPDDEKLETPIDDRGFVKIPELIQAVKSTIDPEYQWRGALNVHHFYWYEQWYKASSVPGVNAHTFREISVHKGLMPVQFHNWLHKITFPPDQPEPGVMSQRIESWTIAKDLFRNVRSAVVWERRARRRAQLIAANPNILPPQFNGEDMIGKEILAGAFNRHFGNFERAIERLRQTVPAEYQFVNPELSYEELAGELGRLMVPPALHLDRVIRAA